jgi:hypothetical protein
MPKAAGTQLLVQFRNSPGAPTFGRRGLLTTIRRGERALSIDQLGDLSIASSAAANACHDFVGSQSPIRIFTLICVAQSIDQIRLPSCLISIASDYHWLVGHELVRRK